MTNTERRSFLKDNFDFTEKGHTPTLMLFRPNTLFPILEGNAGIILQTGGKNEARRAHLYGAGMPHDLDVADLWFATFTHDQESGEFFYADFAIHVGGVFVDFVRKEHGWSGKALTITSNKTEAKLGIHMCGSGTYIYVDRRPYCMPHIITELMNYITTPLVEKQVRLLMC